MATATIDLSAGLVPNAAPGAVDISAGLVPKPAVSQWDAQQEEGHQNRLSALAGLTGMPTPNMSEQDKVSFERGKAAGAISVPLVAGATVAGASGALVPIAKRYGIKALEGAGLGLGYDLYKELKKVFEGE